LWFFSSFSLSVYISTVYLYLYLFIYLFFLAIHTRLELFKLPVGRRFYYKWLALARLNFGNKFANKFSGKFVIPRQREFRRNGKLTAINSHYSLRQFAQSRKKNKIIFYDILYMIILYLFICFMTFRFVCNIVINIVINIRKICQISKVVVLWKSAYILYRIKIFKFKIFVQHL